MSDKMRWRYGDTNPVVAAVASATVIEIGDLVYQDSNAAKPASAQSDAGSEAGNQELFANNFLGVAMQRSRNGDTAPIRVATRGVFEFDCAATNFELGDMIGTKENDDGDALLDQTVARLSNYAGSVDNAKLAIGKAAKRATSATAVLVEIRSAVMYGGIEGTSYSA